MTRLLESFHAAVGLKTFIGGGEGELRSGSLLG